MMCDVRVCVRSLCSKKKPTDRAQSKKKKSGQLTNIWIHLFSLPHCLACGAFELYPMILRTARPSRHRNFEWCWFAALNRPCSCDILPDAIGYTYPTPAIEPCAEHLCRPTVQQALLHHLHQHSKLLPLPPRASLQALGAQGQGCHPSALFQIKQKHQVLYHLSFITFSPQPQPCHMGPIPSLVPPFSILPSSPSCRACMSFSVPKNASSHHPPSTPLFFVTQLISSYSSYGSCGSSESLDTLASSESTLEQGSETTLGPNETPLSHREIAQLSFTFCILWFAANWATNASLAYTSVASSTILASMSGFFTLAIGAALKTESFSALKLIAVCASVIGVALVSESDRGDEPRPMSPTAPRAPLFGDFLALLSALFYGCYTVLLKVKIQNENRINMSLFFGFVGLFNLLLLWPMFGLLHWTGVEPFEFPRDPRIICMIVGNALIGTFV